MLDRVYAIFDKRRRPLRNHVYLAFPEHNVAYARITEPAFKTLTPVLNLLAGNKTVDTSDAFSDLDTLTQNRLLFHGNVELLTARELKRRYPQMKIMAWIQDPEHRIAYCYEKIILSGTTLPSYYSNRFFHENMSPEDFVTHVCGISDIQADNLFRSQTATLNYKGNFIADTVLRLENFPESLDRFLKESSLNIEPGSRPQYEVSDFISDEALSSFTSESMKRKLRKRYKADYDLFNSRDFSLA